MSTYRPMTAASPVLDAALRARHDCGEAIDAIRRAIAVTVDGNQNIWRSRLGDALTSLLGHFEAHREVMETPGGLFDEVSARAPRLLHEIHQLRADHIAIKSEIRHVRTQVTDPSVLPGELRRIVSMLVARLVTHRRLGADLLYQAYEVDIGAED